MKSKITILLCEDDEFLSRMYAHKLNLEGFDAVIVNSGEKVIDAIRKYKPSLVILDLVMPVKTGFEILEELQGEKHKDIAYIPVVVASNLAQEADIAAVKKLGAVDFFVKLNLSPKDLVDKIRVHISS